MVLSMKKWECKVAVVTGASSGIGAAITQKLVENGVVVVGIARRIDRVEELAKKLGGKKGKLIPIKADITKEDELVRAFKTITEKYGPINILVNNAGVSPQGGMVDSPTEIWRRVLETNVIALSVATREAFKIMQAHNISGHIVHINSIAGHTVPPKFPNINIYPASKHAVTALSETLRQEMLNLKSKTKVTSISPGLVETEMTTLGPNLPPGRKEELSQIPILKPEDIADGVIYALSTPEHVQVYELTIRPVGDIF